MRSACDVFVERAVEQSPVVVAGLDRLAVDGEHVVADLEVEPLLVGRAVAVDVRDAVEAAVARLELEAEDARVVAAAASARSAGR